MKLNQFAVYRVDQQTAGKALWHLPYQEARQQNVSITVENYRLVSIHEMQENEKVADIWKRTKNQCEVSDVLVLNKNGEISCYYVDENYPQYLAGFIRINTSGALITMETENYQIDGKKGNWIATDTIIIDGKQFYLMEHQVYRDQAQGVILDAYGKMVVEECKKFDEKTKQKIHDYIQKQDIRLLQKQLAKQNLGSLTTTQICNITFQSDIQKSQGSGNFFHLRIDHIEIMHGKGILNSSQLLHQSIHLLRRSSAKRVTDPIHSFLHLKEIRERRLQHVTDGHTLRKDRMLVQITYADIFCPLDPALIRHQFVSYNIEEGGFSLSVGAYQANMFSF